jgi:hypothetical protein
MSTSSRRPLGATLLDPKMCSALFFSTHNFFGLRVDGGASSADLPPATEIRANADHRRVNDEGQFRGCKPAQRTACIVSTQIMYGATSGAGDFGASIVRYSITRNWVDRRMTKVQNCSSFPPFLLSPPSPARASGPTGRRLCSEDSVS